MFGLDKLVTRIEGEQNSTGAVRTSFLLKQIVDKQHATAYCSTHDFTIDEGSNKVKTIHGKAISSVTEGEVDGARIVGINRKIKSPEYAKQIKSKLGKFYKKLKILMF